MLQKRNQQRKRLKEKVAKHRLKKQRPQRKMLAAQHLDIKEKKNTNCVFKTSPKTGALSTVIFFSGKGRDREERKISLTENQGKFLYYLPFPTEEPKSIQSLLERASIDESYIDEIMDMVNFLIEHTIIERIRR